MSLSRKVIFYTTITTLTVGLMIVGYFIWMLPGLYVDYKINRQSQAVSQMNDQMSQNQSCVLNQADFETLASMSIAITKDSNIVGLCNQYFQAEVTVIHPQLNLLLDDFQKLADQDNSDLSEVSFEADLSIFADYFESNAFNEFFEVNNIEMNQIFATSDGKYDFYQDANNALVFTSQAQDATNQYINLIVVKQQGNQYFMTIASTMMPRLNELSPIILSSTPMIVSFLILFALVTAKAFSKYLALPIETLAKQATASLNDKNIVFKQQNQNDEFKILENALNSMHQNLNATILTIETQNETLKRMQVQHDVFLMNTSHQLKTPIASALLLVESMIHNVGKFKNHDEYLPKVQDELKRMNQIVAALMAVFERKGMMVEVKSIDLKPLIENVLVNYKQQFLKKNISVTVAIENIQIIGNQEMVISIIDNLLSNALKYTPENQRVTIELKKNQLTIANWGVQLDDDMIDVIKQPFVRKVDHVEGNGLGLYLVDTFIQLLNYQWKIENKSDHVVVTIIFKGAKDVNC